MSNTSIQEEDTASEPPVKSSSPVCELTDHRIDFPKTSILPPCAPLAASLDYNDIPVVPGSWYGPGSSSLANDAAKEHHTSQTVNDVLIQTPRRSVLIHSPLHGEASNGLPTPHSNETHSMYHSKDLPHAEMTGHCSMSNLSLEDQNVEEASKTSEVPLSAGYIEDITVPDGQAFSAGVTFIKVWRMVNNGSRDWPAETEVVFVGGAQLTNGNPLPHAQPTHPVGPLKPGQEKTVWTPELRVGCMPVYAPTVVDLALGS